MPSWLSRRVLIIALGLSFVTAGVAYYYLSSAVAKVPVDAGPVTEVVVALQDIPAETRVTREMVATRQIPAQYAHPAAARGPEQVVGKITTMAVLRDEQILAARLAGEGVPRKRLAFSIPDGNRALTIRVDEIKGVAGFPCVGDRVDLLVSHGEPVATKILLQNIQILATGSVTTTLQDGQQILVPSVTLSVTPQQAQIVTQAETTANVRLMLRSPVDEQIVSVPPTTQL